VITLADDAATLPDQELRDRLLALTDRAKLAQRPIIQDPCAVSSSLRRNPPHRRVPRWSPAHQHPSPMVASPPPQPAGGISASKGATRMCPDPPSGVLPFVQVPPGNVHRSGDRQAARTIDELVAVSISGRPRRALPRSKTTVSRGRDRR
jgi:hypothetical protein